MNSILKLVIRYFSFLYDELGARFVDSQVGSMDSALLVLEMRNLRLRFVNDRGPIVLHFQSVDRAATNEWFSFDVLRQLITGVVDDDGIMWGTIGGDPEVDHKKAARNAEFVKANIAEIADAFSAARYSETEKTLHDYEEARAKRLFG